MTACAARATLHVVKVKRTTPIEVELVAQLKARLGAIGRRIADPATPEMERAGLKRRVRKIDRVLGMTSPDEDETTDARLYIRRVIARYADPAPMHYDDGDVVPAEYLATFGALRIANHLQLREDLNPKLVKDAIESWRNGPGSRGRTVGKWEALNALANAAGVGFDDADSLKKWFDRH